jgi:uncharacterized protein (TIGR01777 family)
VRITLLGASGFIGRRLGAALRQRGDEVIAASLRDPAACASLCEGAGAVVNLAGEPVAQRWTPEAKQSILDSRIALPKRLISRFSTLTTPPKAYISASAVGYYGSSEETAFPEASPPGDDFLAKVCIGWEAEAKKAESCGARIGIVRTGIVLGKDGGALAKMLPAFKLGGGGPLGSGRQWQSWIHLDDLIGIYLMLIDGQSGIVNGTAPYPVTNAEFAKQLGRALKRPAFLPVPDFALTGMFGEGAAVLTKGQRVLPERTIQLGYSFLYPELGPALKNIFSPLGQRLLG